MLSNREISRMLGLFSELLLLHQKDERYAGLLSGASYRIRRMSEEVTSISKTELSKLFRPQVVGLIEKLKTATNLDALDELIQLTPPGLFEMMRIRGLGGKKLAILWTIGKIDTLDALLEACKKNKLTKIPGFGKKTQENIVAAIEAYRTHLDRFHYASVADEAEKLVQTIQQATKTKLVSLCGDVRRQSTTVESIEIILAADAKKLSVPALKKVLVIQSSKAGITKAHTLDEIPVTIYHTTSKNFHYELFLRTGNDAHVKKIKSRLPAKGLYDTEETIYKKAKLPFIVPEMREDLAEWDLAKQKGSLLTTSAIKGVVHNHTTWSDGVDELEHFVAACKKKKYEYVVISDHSKNAHYAGGLKEDKAIEQIKVIDKLNKKAGIRIFKSIECDILVSGELDYGNDLLKRYDMVIVSIHQLLKMDEEKATKRLIKAIENPYTTILGHMTGRQLLIRPGYPVNFKKVIDACAANKVVIEINANPYRLDMDWTQVPYAIKKGVMISINPDAHSIAEIDNIRWGVSAARKAGLSKEMTWNAMGVAGIEKWLKNKRK